MRISLALLLVLALFAGCKKEKKKLPSGYDYIMHTSSKGQAAEPNAMAYFHFQMRNDDSVVVSSYSEPMMPMVVIPDTTNLGRPLSPIEEALMLMREGDSLTIIAPLDTVEPKPQGFEKSKFLYYDLVLKDVKTQKEMEEAVTKVEAMTKKTLDAFNKGTLENIQTTASGLKYVIHEEGKGARADSSDMVFVNYYGALMDGTMFDNSFSRGSEFNFPVGMGAVIPGWDEGLMLLKSGTKATLFIPSALAYGAAGAPPAIPADADLMFYIELNNVRKMN
ncbi:MAG: FKBP-type peptidyl-prolyl cis-trans isomerase [Haliscomenobacter sp.]|nr:FKBP-type peptidyl-prolyl cis-trans isomerase [Haliscomenobacter sp.]MBK7474705.1 FKBP-type peptidyl-prolyl cis-trans isomerase [Haliscomenobacter sp.]MBK8877649.1 FKBP-type peptidyl-prolyl cis-trans isomerase [Haliscomenobacter sp.]